MTFCSDETGTTKTMIFSKKLEICREENGVLPKNDIVIVSGTKQDEVVFDSISIQNTNNSEAV